MKRIFKIGLILMLLFIPTMVLANNNQSNLEIDILPALGMEAFVTIHMSLFVLMPLSNILSTNDSKRVFWILFIIRVVVLVFFDLCVTTSIALVDFLAVFVGAFIVVPLASALTGREGYSEKITNRSHYHVDYTDNTESLDNEKHSIFDKGICPYCGGAVSTDMKVCDYCGGKNEFY